MYFWKSFCSESSLLRLTKFRCENSSEIQPSWKFEKVIFFMMRSFNIIITVTFPKSEEIFVNNLIILWGIRRAKVYFYIFLKIESLTLPIWRLILFTTFLGPLIPLITINRKKKKKIFNFFFTSLLLYKKFWCILKIHFRNYTIYTPIKASSTKKRLCNNYRNFWQTL